MRGSWSISRRAVQRVAGRIADQRRLKFDGRAIAHPPAALECVHQASLDGSAHLEAASSLLDVHRDACTWPKAPETLHQHAAARKVHGDDLARRLHAHTRRQDPPRVVHTGKRTLLSCSPPVERVSRR